MADTSNIMITVKRAGEPPSYEKPAKIAKTSAEIKESGALKKHAKQERLEAKAIELAQFVRDGALQASYGLDNNNPFRSIPHPTKTRKDGITPVKKPLTKAEKGIADAWDRGHHDMLSWRTGCLSPDGQKEKGIITAICVDRVSAIIIACFPTDPYCIAFTPEQEIDISVWAGSTKGRKKQDLSADSTGTIIAKVRDRISRDRRMAWKALQSCPVYVDYTQEKNVVLVKALMTMFNERFRAELYNEHQISGSDFAKPEEYCVGTDEFLRLRMQLKDDPGLGRSWPLAPTASSSGEFEFFDLVEYNKSGESKPDSEMEDRGVISNEAEEEKAQMENEMKEQEVQLENGAEEEEKTREKSGELMNAA